MALKANLEEILLRLKSDTKLIVVTKTRSIEELKKVYELGYKVFGENRVQELVEKYEALPKDIEWHLIGHLQTNKVKYIAPFIHMIHSVDSFKLLEEINKQAQKNDRVVLCLLQIYIAKEETKFGLDPEEALAIIHSSELKTLENIKIVGLMGMATNTENQTVVEHEFKSLKIFFDQISPIHTKNVAIAELSMGMSNDYQIASELGSTLVRVGSAVFRD